MRRSSISRRQASTLCFFFHVNCPSSKCWPNCSRSFQVFLFHSQYVRAEKKEFSSWRLITAESQPGYSRESGRYSRDTDAILEVQHIPPITCTPPLGCFFNYRMGPRHGPDLLERSPLTRSSSSSRSPPSLAPRRTGSAVRSRSSRAGTTGPSSITRRSGGDAPWHSYFGPRSPQTTKMNGFFETTCPFLNPIREI